MKENNLISFDELYTVYSSSKALGRFLRNLYRLINSSRTSNELLSLEKAVCAWTEWESALRELQGALRGDLATLESLRDRTEGNQTDVTAQIRQLAASLVEKKKVS